MNCFWLKSYPKGISADIDLNQCSSVPATLAHICDHYPNNQAYTNFIGLAIPSTYIKIKDSADNGLGIDTEEELCIQEPQLIQG